MSDPPQPADVRNDIGLTRAAMTVLTERYLRRDADGQVCESGGQMLDRVAEYVATAEDRYHPGSSAQWATRFSTMLRSLEFLPNSPTLMNAGTSLGVLSGCFVLPIDDSLASIFDTLRTTAMLHHAGAGTGFSFSRLRPRGDIVAPSGGTASGPVSFIELYDAASQVVRLGGRRRAANMAVLDIGHPDIEAFISAKAEPGKLPTFNLSVGITDQFMRAAADDLSYPLVNPRTGRTVRTVRARPLLDRIAEYAWHSGEPGLLFLDAVNRANPVPALGPIAATNPCGEVPLIPYESCNLGSINVSRFVVDGHLDHDRLADTARLAVRFLDDVIDVSEYPLPELAAAARATRKIGLGIMGLADALATLGIPYDSEDAVRFAENLMNRIAESAHRTSGELAIERGAFPMFARSRWAAEGAAPLRNAQVTAIAPTGTISLIAGTSSGIEPLFALHYTRDILGREVHQADRLFRQRATALGVWTPAVAAHVAATGSATGCPDIPEALRRGFVTAFEVAPWWQLRMQAAVQRHTDAAVSKTINLPESTRVEDVRAIIEQAWRANVKGVTVYRSGTRRGQVLRLPDTARSRPAYPGPGGRTEPEC